MLVKTLGALFADADADGSGELSKSEVRTLIDSIGFGDVTDEYIAGVWGIFDTDGSGALDMAEVEQMVEVLADEKRKRIELEEGKAADVWNSGKNKAQSKREQARLKTYALKAIAVGGFLATANGGGSAGFVPKTPPLSSEVVYTGPRAAEMENVRKLFLEADADASGALDKGEVRTLIDALKFSHVSDTYLEGVWGIFDADGDGVLDLDEVQEMVSVLSEEKQREQVRANGS